MTSVGGGLRGPYHLINLFQGAAVDFGQEEVDPNRGHYTGREPDVAVTRTPVQRLGIYEVRSGESDKPSGEERHG